MKGTRKVNISSSLHFSYPQKVMTDTIKTSGQAVLCVRGFLRACACTLVILPYTASKTL